MASNQPIQVKDDSYESGRKLDVQAEFRADPRRQHMQVGAEAARKSVAGGNTGAVSVYVAETITVTNSYNF